MDASQKHKPYAVCHKMACLCVCMLELPATPILQLCSCHVSVAHRKSSMLPNNKRYKVGQICPETTQPPFCSKLVQNRTTTSTPWRTSHAATLLTMPSVAGILAGRGEYKASVAIFFSKHASSNPLNVRPSQSSKVCQVRDESPPGARHGVKSAHGARHVGVGLHRIVQVRSCPLALKTDVRYLQSNKQYTGVVLTLQVSFAQACLDADA